jgi:putative PIN family toxin of toxin-antitoxin system
MPRVVVDTNVFISAYLFGGVPGRFLRAGLEGYFSLLTSEVLLDEPDEKLASKFQMDEGDRSLIQEELRAAAEIISSRISLQAIAEDPDDDRVLECAVAGVADCIVTGDRYLLKLKSYGGIAILTLRQFHDQFFPNA